MSKRPQLKKLDVYGIVDTGASDPAVGEDGELFYNTTSSSLKIWITSAWVAIGTGGGGGFAGSFYFTSGDGLYFVDGNEMSFVI